MYGPARVLKFNLDDYDDDDDVDDGCDDDKSVRLAYKREMGLTHLSTYANSPFLLIFW